MDNPPARPCIMVWVKVLSHQYSLMLSGILNLIAFIAVVAVAAWLLSLVLGMVGIVLPFAIGKIIVVLIILCVILWLAGWTPWGRS